MTDRSEEQASAPNDGTAQVSGEVAEDAEDAVPAVGEEGDAQPGSGGPGELQALRDRYLRLAAEYDNFRKRTDRERTESWTRAQAQIVQMLLDPLDDLRRVADFSAETTPVQSLLDGVQMVERKLSRALQAAGLEVVEASGHPFDPSMHEALMTAPADRAEDDESVGEVFQQGYRFKGELLRPARVQVRKFEG